MIVKEQEKALSIANRKQKGDIYRMYVVWRTIPPMLKGKKPEALELFGITDAIFQKLSGLKNKSAFAKEFKVHNDTITNWEKDITVMETDDASKKFFAQMTYALQMKFYQRQLQEPTAEGIKTWKQIVHDWHPSINLNIHTTVEHKISDEEREKIKQIIRENRTR